MTFVFVIFWPFSLIKKALFFLIKKAPFYQKAPFFNQKCFPFFINIFPFSQAHFIQSGTTLAQDTLG